MLKIKEIIDITNAIVINGKGNEDKNIEYFNISNKNYYENDFYIPKKF